MKSLIKQLNRGLPLILTHFRATRHLQYIPKIEVTFFLDKNDILTAEARELDADNHKAWREAGGAIVLRQ